MPKILHIIYYKLLYRYLFSDYWYLLTIETLLSTYYWNTTERCDLVHSIVENES